MFSYAVGDVDTVAARDTLKNTKTNAKTRSTQEKKPTWTVSPPPAYTRRNNRINIPRLNPNSKTRAQLERKFIKTE
jgi:hypothetical protein